MDGLKSHKSSMVPEIEELDRQTSLPSFGDSNLLQDHYSQQNDLSFSNYQTSSQVHQNEHTKIPDQSSELNSSSKGGYTADHRKCPTCLRAYPATQNLVEYQQLQNNNLLHEETSSISKRLQEPATVQCGDVMTSVEGIISSSPPVLTQQSPNIQYLHAESPSKRSLGPAACKKTKSKCVPKTQTRKIPNAKCELCSRSFTRVYDLQRHWVSLHSGQALRWICTYCDGKRSYCRKEKLKRHLREHHPQFDLDSLDT
ncbi:hypothetical protein BGZ60DRAFT_534926 [Tricladium varicosporioides]|nr:hypothetical protein BGZ60DRAFT_534926 [Hymenoscyphus varicosporioides]